MPGWVIHITYGDLKSEARALREEWIAFIPDEAAARAAVVARTGGIEPTALRQLEDAAFAILGMKPGDVRAVGSTGRSES